MSDFIHLTTGKDYEKITNINGVQTTVCANRFEILTKPTAELHEEQVLQAVREWVRWRNQKVMPDAGCMPE
jgi:hypothetical protein